MRREKEDRNVLRSSPLLNQGRELDATHAGHPDVEHECRKVVANERKESLVRGRRANQMAIGTAQHRLEHVEVSRLVVDDQDLGFFTHSGPTRTYRYSHTRSSERS